MELRKRNRKHSRLIVHMSGVHNLTRIEKTKWLHGGKNYVRDMPARMI